MQEDCRIGGLQRGISYEFIVVRSGCELKYIELPLVVQDDLSLTKAEDQMELETLRGVALNPLNDSIADYTVALADVRGEVNIPRAFVFK